MKSPYDHAIDTARDLRRMVPSSRAARDVLAERDRQVEDEGWTPEHDDQHVHGEIAIAAACYAYGEDIWSVATGGYIWPWHEDWWKPGDRRRDLVKAGALILAEIERIDRATKVAPQRKPAS